MSELLSFSAALVAGSALGCFFFGGLWWTVQKALTSNHPALRTGIVVVGFYFISFGDWRRLLICLLGFFIARILVTRLTRISAGGRDAPE